MFQFLGKNYSNLNAKHIVGMLETVAIVMVAKNLAIQMWLPLKEFTDAARRQPTHSFKSLN
jgi:hypothetical protein